MTRKAWKFRIVKGLYERGMAKEDIRQMLRFIDWMMELPAPLALEFDRDIHEYEQETHVPYITSWERHGIQKGERKGYLYGIAMSLEIKFGKAGLRCLPMIRKIDDLKALKAVGKAIKKAATVEKLRAALE